MRNFDDLRMLGRLLVSGVPENQIQDIMHSQPHQGMGVTQTTNTTYTRIARKRLSIEALRVKAIEFELDEVSPSVPTYISYSPTPAASSSFIITDI